MGSLGVLCKELLRALRLMLPALMEFAGFLHRHLRRHRRPCTAGANRCRSAPMRCPPPHTAMQVHHMLLAKRALMPLAAAGPSPAWFARSRYTRLPGSSRLFLHLGGCSLTAGFQGDRCAVFGCQPLPANWHARFVYHFISPVLTLSAAVRQGRVGLLHGGDQGGAGFVDSFFSKVSR